MQNTFSKQVKGYGYIKYGLTDGETSEKGITDEKIIIL